MEVIMVIVISISVFIFFYGKEKQSVEINNHPGSGIGNYVDKSPTAYSPGKPATISVTPNKIVTNPEKKLSVINGEYRYFKNYYISGRQYTFGFPKANCRDKQIWIGINKEEHGRVSESEALAMIKNNSVGRLYAKKQSYGIWDSSYSDTDLPF